MTCHEPLKKPPWLKIRIKADKAFSGVSRLMRKKDLHTVCQEAGCPNIYECWSRGTATFMILGDICTRACRFCNVRTGYPRTKPDPDEPSHIADSVRMMGIGHVVITSVDRDDLEDQGASQFVRCVNALREKLPEVKIELLIPDFMGQTGLISTIINAKPDILAHNIEVVERLQKELRDTRAGYSQSLKVLNHIMEKDSSIYTKSSVMVGVGEKKKEVLKAMDDLRAAGVSILTIGQYLRPSKRHYPVKEYISPETFKYYRNEAVRKGFGHVVSGPFVRSSYKAEESLEVLNGKSHKRIFSRLSASHG